MQTESTLLTERTPVYLAFLVLVFGLSVTGLRADGWHLFSWQGSTLFKQATGYALLGGFVFLASYGWLRRRPAENAIWAYLPMLHHWAGVLMMVVLFFHMGHRPAGQQLALVGMTTLAIVSGALRAHVPRQIGAFATKALLLAHIVSACLVLSLSVAHIYFVYSYTA